MRDEDLVKWFFRGARICAWVLGSLYCLQLGGRIVFMIVEGGMERSDGMGSPLAFLFGMVIEFLFLGLPALLLAGFVRCRTLRQEFNRVAGPPRTSGPFSVVPPAPGCGNVERGIRF
ncbi:MAG: hypothetical protein ABUL68_02035 [Pseudomonadota bacterium]